MRSDAKLGMALGMLVVGFAIAFCFPREGRVSVAQQVAFNQKPVETEDIEFVPIRQLRSDGTSANNQAQQAVVPEESGVATTDVQETLPADDDTVAVNSPLIDVESSLQSILEQGNNVEEAAELAVDDQVEKSTYLVQPGDTLSEISMKTLGSYRRYLDIFEANRDQLDSPDDLRLGMILKIPTDPTSRAAQLADQSQVDEVLPADVDPATPREPRPSQKQFGNAGRRPFLSDRSHQMPVHQIPSQQTRSHLVETGDTLERIAVRYFGTVRAIRQIHAANPGLLDDPNRLKPGTVLKLIP